MGSIKDWINNIEDAKFNKELAELLDISIEDWQLLDYKLLTEESTHGIIYQYVIQFYPSSPQKILDKIKRLDHNTSVKFYPWELDEKFNYEEQFETITDNKHFVKKYEIDIENLKALTHLKTPDDTLKSVLNRQIFIGVIGTMETFLADVFINLSFENEKYFRKFVKTHPDFEKRKFELKEIFEQSDNLKETAKKIMLNTIYHNLPTVREMYRNTFEIDFPKIKETYQYVLMRHDLVHRNGKTKEGKEVITDKKAIIGLIQSVNELVYGVAKELKL
ncbi:hypothetical protein [Zobellia alginiliquefaciens]|uniref:hypothetical protein n=1 Tax=Zobellia alginiliquefaciens TaxID=3032586 RepID=UPI0023E3FB90|nr:hypothetical protein [Zobellia alginiliquefaciens]